jgi:phosphomannomutase
LANVELTPEYALAFGRTAALVLGASTFVVGRDTRVSGPMIEAALCAGLAAEGATVRRMGVCPTPAVAWVAAREGVAGVVISASHNPFADNGIKLFAPGGLKLSDADQASFEPVLARIAGAGAPGGGDARPRAGAEVGRLVDDPEAVEGWAADVAASIAGRRLDGTAVVVDCANGAASAVAPATLRALGAEVEVVETPVGDRYVLEALERGGWTLGGEQSGHVIFRDLATTGDGLLTAVQVLDLVCRSGASLAELADDAMTRLPQVLRNVVVRGSAAAVADAIAGDVAAASARLGEAGRVLVRPSGTEPLLRVMVEAPDEATAAGAVAELVAAAERVAGD